MTLIQEILSVIPTVTPDVHDAIASRLVNIRPKADYDALHTLYSVRCLEFDRELMKLRRQLRDAEDKIHFLTHKQ